MSDLRVQRCDNCGKWKRPTSLTSVTVMEKTGYIRSREHPEPIVDATVQMWCLTCYDAVKDAVAR